MRFNFSCPLLFLVSVCSSFSTLVKEKNKNKRKLYQLQTLIFALLLDFFRFHFVWCFQLFSFWLRLKLRKTCRMYFQCVVEYDFFCCSVSALYTNRRWPKLDQIISKQYFLASFWFIAEQQQKCINHFYLHCSPLISYYFFFCSIVKMSKTNTCYEMRYENKGKKTFFFFCFFFPLSVLNS